MRALVVAGGEGQRLRPLTNETPKSLLMIGNHPLLEHTLIHLRGHGVTDVTLAVKYLASMIENYFGTGERLGMRISYLHEKEPLGTAGALACIPEFNDTMIMMNGDLMTDLDFSRLQDLHRSSGAALTVASKLMQTTLSLGVLDLNKEGFISGYREKPKLEHRFSIGMYMVEPVVKNYLESGKRLDMPDLITRLIAAGRSVACYDHKGKWTDIGLPEDYAQAQKEALEAVPVPALVALHARVGSSRVGPGHVRPKGQAARASNRETVAG